MLLVWEIYAWENAVFLHAVYGPHKPYISNMKCSNTPCMHNMARLTSLVCWQVGAMARNGLGIKLQSGMD